MTQAENRVRVVISHAVESESLASRMPSGCGFLFNRLLVLRQS